MIQNIFKGEKLFTDLTWAIFLESAGNRIEIGERQNFIDQWIPQLLRFWESLEWQM